MLGTLSILEISSSAKGRVRLSASSSCFKFACIVVFFIFLSLFEKGG